jgi:PAS domain S-box-containing protein
MDDRENRQDYAYEELRRNAEQRLRTDHPPSCSPWSGAAPQRTIHELEVCQIELELQNAQLSTCRNEAEAALERYTDLYDFAPIGYLTLDRAGAISSVNLRAAAMLGVERAKLTGQRFGQFVAGESRLVLASFLEGAYANRRKQNCEIVIRVTSRAPIFVQLDGIVSPGGEECRIAMSDITDRKLLESQLLHSQKLESLGILAGGIAHDFNNILMAILGNAEIAMLHLDQESAALENLQRIQQAAARAAELTKQMLAYSGKGIFVFENVNLSLLLESMMPLLRASISNRVQLKTNLHRPLPTIVADATQMHQVVMNLVINASEAIGERNGVITVTTGVLQGNLSDQPGDRDIQGPDVERSVFIEVSDDGCGMDQGVLSKLFDPFFTTKFTGRGLGLAAVQGIVNGHQGSIRVTSAPGAGTTFRILFPASGKCTELSPKRDNAAPGNWRGKGTVLLVDDEEEVRNIGAKMLQALGYTPITANNGLEAISIFKETPDLAFIILDLTMPIMDGEQCLRELQRLDPAVKVIMSSGYNEQELSATALERNTAGFIQKPYLISELKEIVLSLS